MNQDTRSAGVPLWLFGLLAVLVLLLVVVFSGANQANNNANIVATTGAEIAQVATGGAQTAVAVQENMVAQAGAVSTSMAVEIQEQRENVVAARENGEATLQAFQAEAIAEIESAATSQAQIEATLAAQSDILAGAQSDVEALQMTATVQAAALAAAESDAANSAAKAFAVQGLAAAGTVNTYPAALLLGVESADISGGSALGGSLQSILSAQPEIGGFLSGNTGTIYALTYGPDGKLIAVGDSDTNVRVYDTESHVLAIPILAEHTGEIYALAFSPDGTTLASGASDNKVLLWDVATGERIGPRLIGHTDAVEGLAFSPDGTILASGSYDGTIRLWDVATGDLLNELVESGSNRAPIWSVVFSPDGAALASGSDDGSVKLWNVATGTFARAFTGLTSAVYGLDFSPNGKLLASASGEGAALIWYVRDGSQFNGLFGTELLSDVDFSPNGEDLVVTGISIAEYKLLPDTQSLEFLRRLPLPDVAHVRSRYSPDGATIAVSADDEVILWQESPPVAIVKTLDVQTDIVRGVTFSPDGNTLAAGSQDGTFVLWDVTNNQLLHQINDEGGGTISIAYSPDGTNLATGNEDNNVRIWDAETGDLLDTWGGHTNWVLSLAYSPDGSKLVSGDTNGLLFVWDTATGEKLVEVNVEDRGNVSAVAFSLDGELIAAGLNDATLQVWNAETGEAAGEPFVGHTESVFTIAFSPDGKTLASGGADTAIIIWDVASGAILQYLNGHSDSVFTLAFSPDGAYLASGAADGAVVIWDTSTYQPVSQSFAQEADWINSLAFSPDGSTLAAGIGGTSLISTEIVVWSLDTSTMPGIACQIAGRNFTQSEWTQYMGDAPYRKMCDQWDVHSSVVEVAADEAYAAATGDNTEGAEAAYTRAVELALDSSEAGVNNNICWFGSLQGYVEIVKPACEHAVALAPSDSNYVDSRGLARALTGDFEGAIADFQNYANWAEAYGYNDSGEQRLEWIVRLTAGDNPFDEETLSAMLQE